MNWNNQSSGPFRPMLIILFITYTHLSEIQISPYTYYYRLNNWDFQVNRTKWIHKTNPAVSCLWWNATAVVLLNSNVFVDSKYSEMNAHSICCCSQLEKPWSILTKFKVISSWTVLSVPLANHCRKPIKAIKNSFQNWARNPLMLHDQIFNR